MNQSPPLDTDEHNPLSWPLESGVGLQLPGVQDPRLITHLYNELWAMANTGTQGLGEPGKRAVPQHSTLGHWLSVYRKAINAPAFLDWAKRHALKLDSLVLHSTSLQASTPTGPVTFTLDDDSGWRALANPILSVAHSIDVANLGLAYIDEAEPALPLASILAFHGYPLPHNRPQARQMLEELGSLQAFPLFTEQGRSLSAIHNELEQQYSDFQHLAEVLAAHRDQASRENRVIDLAVLNQQRVILGSGSWLARTMDTASRQLKQLIRDYHAHALDSGQPIPPSRRYYARAQEGLFPVAPANTRPSLPAGTLIDAGLGAPWHTLNQLLVQLDIEVHTNRTFSLQALLHAYDLTPATNAHELDALIYRLRQRQPPAFVPVSECAFSASDLRSHQRHIGAHNDYYSLTQALLATDKPLSEMDDWPVIEVDPHTYRPFLAAAAQHLRELTQHPRFQEIASAHQLSPDSPIRLSADRRITARTRSGLRVQLQDAVQAVEGLHDLTQALFERASKTGGEISSDASATFKQLMALYRLGGLHPASRATVGTRLLRIKLRNPPLLGGYWRALQEALSTVQRLTATERQNILGIIATTVPEPHPNLLHYLSQAQVEDKFVPGIRAEGDYLLARILNSPRAQHLAERLGTATTWPPGDDTPLFARAHRNARTLTALLLSLDPDFSVLSNQVAGFDLMDSDNWGKRSSAVYQSLDEHLAQSGIGWLQRPLAMHLLLAGTAPELLLRGIESSAPHMSSQIWLIVRQHVLYLEHLRLGSSHEATYLDIIALSHLPTNPTRRVFLDSDAAVQFILDWAVVNGILERKAHFPPKDYRAAIKALNLQRQALIAALQSLEEPVVTLHQSALADLRWVFPNNTALEQRLLARRPGDTPSADARLYSLVELHSAAQLKHRAQQWHCPSGQIDYPSLSREFARLNDAQSLYAAAFDSQVMKIKQAYIEILCYELSQLSRAQREALEYGHLSFFTLATPTAAATAPRAHYGLLLRCVYQGAVQIFEVFATQFLIVARQDLSEDHHNAFTSTEPDAVIQLPFDLSAHLSGTVPIADAVSRVRLRPLAQQLPAVPAPQDQPLPLVPNTLNSPRTDEIASLIVDRHLMSASQALSDALNVPLTLAQVTQGPDPWAQFLASLAPLKPPLQEKPEISDLLADFPAPQVPPEEPGQSA